MANQMGNLMLKTSSRIINSRCKFSNVPDKICAEYLRLVDVKSGTDLARDCQLMRNFTKNRGHPNTFRRLLDADYLDGVYKIRRDVYNKDLPLPRKISSAFFEASQNVPNADASILKSSEGRLDSKRNILFVQFSQFLEQNLVKTIPQTLSKLFR